MTCTQWKLTAITTLSILLCSLTSSQADVIHLKSGGKIEGSIVDSREGRIEVRTRAGSSFIDESDVLTIEKAEVPWEIYKERFDSLAPNDATACFQLAKYCIENSMEAEAIELLRDALRIQPVFPEAKSALAEAIDFPANAAFSKALRLQKAGNISEAQQLWQRVIDRYPESRYANQALHGLAITHADQGIVEKALELWQQAIRSDKSFTPAYLGVAAIAERKGLWTEAVQLLNTALKYEISDDILVEIRSRFDASRSVLVLLEKLDKDPGNPDLLENLAKTYQQLGLKDRSLETFATAVEAGSRNTDVLLLLARHYSEILDLNSAMHYWTEVSEQLSDPAEATEAEEKIGQLRTLQLVPQFFTSKDPEERKALLKSIEASGLPFEQIANVARKGPVYIEQARGLTSRTLTVGMEQIETGYFLHVPENYDPQIAAPMIVALHPLRSQADHYIRLWGRAADEMGFIILAPQSYEGSWFAREASIVYASINDVRTIYNVDTDRIHVVGASLGGESALLAALYRPEWFASLAVLSSGVQGKALILLPNILRIPTYIVHSQLDTKVPVAVASQVANSLKGQGAEVNYLELPGPSTHSAFPNKWRDVVTWFETHPRNTYPDRIALTTHSILYGKAYWIRAARLSERVYDPDQPASIEVPSFMESSVSKRMYKEIRQKLVRRAIAERMARIDASVDRDANRIDITTRRVKEIEIFLSDTIIDLDLPVRIFINKQLVFEGKLQRSVQFMLQNALRSRDYAMLFANSLRLEVPQD